jgi:hypothetical protein
MATPTPYKAKQRGDLIQAEDWNDIQIQSRVEIQSHDHSGDVNGKKISYHNLDDIPTTFPPVAHQHRGEELTIENLRIGGNLQVERSGFFTGNVGIGVPAPTEKLEVAGIVKATEFVKHDGTPIGSKWLDGTGGIHYDTGKVGIGTPAPREALEVHGNIRLGQGGSFYALAALHNVCVIVGKVHDDGSKVWGDGFQSRKTDPGRYHVEFDEPFAGVPVVIAGCTGTNPGLKETVGCHDVSDSGFDVRIWRNAGDNKGNRWVDNPFDFIVLGLK